MYNSEIGDATYAEFVEASLNAFAAEHDAIGDIEFGLAVFPSTSCPAGGSASPEECTPANDDPPNPDDDAPTVPIGPDNTNAIAAALAGVGQCGGTPLCGSLQWIDDYFAEWELVDGKPDVVLLFTDGAPNCNPAGDPETCAPSAYGVDPIVPEQCLDDVCTYNAALTLSVNDIDVLVVGIGADATLFGDVMQGIAYYGAHWDPEDEGVPAEPTFWYPASTTPALDAALEEIAAKTTPCTIPIEWSEIPDYYPEPPYIPLEKACDSIGLAGLSAAEVEVYLEYSPDCEEDSDIDLYAWRWTGIDAPLYELDEYPLDQCDEIELCPEACARRWDGTWSGMGITLQCEPWEFD